MANTLTITENLTITNITEETITAQLKAISAFQSLIKSQFKENFHMGVIPGTGKKPTLLQPGAQVICTLLSLQPRYSIVEKTRDFKSGLFEYIVQCQLIGGDGLIHAESIASANSFEAKFQREAKYNENGERLGIGNMDNTVLKMAQKRALVAAALFIGNLSDVFTQDFDDADIRDLNGNEAKTNSVEDSREKPITKSQATRMYAISNGNGDLCKKVIAKYGYNSSSEVKVKDYNAICSEIENEVKQQVNGWVF